MDEPSPTASITPATTGVRTDDPVAGKPQCAGGPRTRHARSHGPHGRPKYVVECGAYESGMQHAGAPSIQAATACSTALLLTDAKSFNDQGRQSSKSSASWAVRAPQKLRALSIAVAAAREVRKSTAVPTGGGHLARCRGTFRAAGNGGFGQQQLCRPFDRHVCSTSDSRRLWCAAQVGRGGPKPAASTGSKIWALYGRPDVRKPWKEVQWAAGFRYLP
jgi:hypothetical protein